MFNLFKNQKHLVSALVATTALLATACGGGGSGANPSFSFGSYKVEYVNDYFMTSFVFKSLALDGGGRVPLTNLPNSYVEFGPDFGSAGTRLTIGLARKDVVKGDLTTLDPQYLPGVGQRPLPGIAGYSLPGFAFEIPGLKNLVFYFGNDAFGLFIPVAKILPDNMVATSRLYSGKNRVGTISAVGSNSSKDPAGLLLLIQKQLPAVASVLK